MRKYFQPILIRIVILQNEGRSFNSSNLLDQTEHGPIHAQDLGQV